MLARRPELRAWGFRNPASCDRCRCMTKAARSERGLFGTLVILVGGGCLLVALLGVFNTAFELKLALSVSGTNTPLPDSYDVVAGVAAAGVLLIGLAMFGGFVRDKFAAAKGKPLVRVGIILGALALLALVGRGLQVLALTQTYGSMLAYYATDGDLADVKAELARGPDTAALDAAVGRAGQYNNAAALALLLEAGADLRDSSETEERRRCALMGRSFDFIKTAIDHGVKPDACPRGETAVYEAVRFGEDDAEVARIVALLLSAGWSATAAPEYDKQTPKDLAAQKKWTATLQALAAAPK
jgi:hypothetical protein